MRSTPILLAAALAAAAFVRPMHAQTPEAALVAGAWRGAIEIPGYGGLPIVFRITASGDELAATLDSPDQAVYDIRSAPVTWAGDTLVIVFPTIGGRYEGVLDGDSLRGTWTQGEAAVRLALGRADGDALRPARPQEPKPPYPYDAIEVTFANEEAGITLAGTLTRPEGEGPFPAVVLVSGSGPQDRDGSVFGHKPFLVLADHLTRRGIAVLRFDDRGVGGSTGEFAATTAEDLAADALAAVRYLRGRDDIDTDRIGLVGHSEGGLVAPIAANRSDDVAFLVLLAAPSIPFDSLIPIQTARIAKAAGAGDDAAELQVALVDTLFAILRTTPDAEAAAERMRTTLRSLVEAVPVADRGRLGLPVDGIDAFIDAQVRSFLTPGMRYLTGFDPTVELRRLSVPVLALTGSLDLQVPPDVNLPPLRRALRDGGNPHVEVRTLPGLNHLLQPARTGAPSEYRTIETTMAPEALDAITEWIVRRVGSGA